MKIVFRMGLAACLCVSLVGLAVGQDYYGGYYPNQDQGYGAYGSSGYGQASANYGQRPSQGYGSPYGYAEPSSGVQGYPPSYGYDTYPGVPGYGRYDNTPYGAGRYGLPSISAQDNQPTLRSRVAPRVGRGGGPEIRESTRVVTPSRNRARAVQQPEAVPTSTNSDEGSLYSNEIYWDGGNSDRQRSFQAPSQSQPVQSVNQPTPAPRSSTAIRQTKPFSNPGNQPRIQHARPNVVRQETKAASVVPPPPASGFKWGKENNDLGPKNAEPRQSFKWGMQSKPSMVGSEPGRINSSQAPSQVSAQDVRQEASNSIGNGPKKFQWGSVK
ncbi:MAG: hypothetical protein M0T73_08905 [Deltaproteobacteria bacterium]|nr:hypothetical protein [Deltaproteobacteria bacterium]